MTNDEMNQKIQEFLNNDGEITQLRYGSLKEQRRSRRIQYHEDRALAGSERSQEVLESTRKRESEMIFSRNERWRVEK